MIVGISLALVAAGAPILVAFAVVLGLPAVVLAAAQPRVALVLLALSIPFGAWVTVSVGSVRIAPTDVLIVILALGWIVRELQHGRLPRIVFGPTIVALLLVFCVNFLAALTAEEFPDAAKELIKLAEMLVVALYASSALATEAESRFAILALLAVGAIESLNGLRQFVTRSGPDFFALGPFMRAFGDFGQPNALAGYLGMLLPWGLVMSFRATPGRRWTLLMTALIFAAIGATWSRGAWLGSLLGLSIMALAWSAQTRRALALATAGAAGLVALGLAGALPATLVDRLTVMFENFIIFDVTKVELTPANWSLVERMAHWQAGWDMARDHPWLGVGPGNFAAAYPRYYLDDWLEPLGHAHNFYINTLAETGVIGLLALLIFMVTIYVSVGRTLVRGVPAERLSRGILIAMLGSAVTLHVHNSFDNMLVHGIEVQFALLLGLTEAARRRVAADRAEAEPMSTDLGGA